MNHILKKVLKSGHLVEDAWNGFWHKIKPKAFPANQPIEMRKAFICGFFASFDLMTTVSSALNEEEAMEVLDKIQAECVRSIKEFSGDLFETLKNKTVN